MPDTFTLGNLFRIPLSTARNANGSPVSATAPDSSSFRLRASSQLADNLIGDSSDDAARQFVVQFTMPDTYIAGSAFTISMGMNFDGETTPEEGSEIILYASNIALDGYGVGSTTVVDGTIEGNHSPIVVGGYAEHEWPVSAEDAATALVEPGSLLAMRFDVNHTALAADYVYIQNVFITI